ncbi:hypothetical protein HYV11_02710, partial [Candidatus Dependentiae bacterium]|nr:hypothetical protein [Candidatus Dependentiae bacterium]
SDYRSVSKAILAKDITQEQSEHIWNFYCTYQHFLRTKKINYGYDQIKEKYERFKKKKIDTERREAQQRKAAEHQQFLKESYQTSLGNATSAYHDARQKAYEKTVQYDYLKVHDSCKLDTQTMGFCIAHHIDYNLLQHHHATALQHQLYQEVTDCFQKNAQILSNQTFLKFSICSTYDACH